MTVRKPHALLLPLAIAFALSACNRDAPKAADTPAAAATPAPDQAPTLDDSKLPPVIHFAASDLDASKNACSDFGGYVNGKWLTANPIPGDRSSWGAFDALIERSLAVQHQLAERAGADTRATGVEKIVGDFWATGMDEAKIEAQGLDPLKPELAKIDAITDGPSIADYLRSGAAEGKNALFGFGPEADFKDSTMTLAYATQGGLGLPERGYYFDKDKREKLAAYEKHIAKVLELSGTPAADAATQAKAVIAFETRLADKSLSSEKLHRDVSLYYNATTPAEADKLTPNFPWSKFFESQGLAVPAKFSLAMPAFHEEVSKMLGDTAPETWKAYLRFHAVDDASPYLAKAFVDENYDFYNRIMRDQKEQKARWKRVLGAIDNDAGEALGQLYVKVAFPPESKAKMDALVENMRTALKARIDKLDWMSPETKQKALAKWAGFSSKIGYPSKWRDWSGLTTSRDSYLGNVEAANAFNYKWQLGKIGKPVDKAEWGMSPQTVNAGYNPLNNDITFPAAILQPPFFDPKADDAMNYGGIGAVIGHEMIHGYDDQGSRFGPSGNFEQWWTPADAKAFSGRTDKLIQQFSGYQALPNLKVNGRLTLGENIADLGGLNTAYDAMKTAAGNTADPMADGFNRDQRFFLNFATIWRDQMTKSFMEEIVNTDEHAPGEFRAIGAPSNMPAFAAAFQCKAGDAMVRGGDKQVVIW